jgi:hypothetical protein
MQESAAGQFLHDRSTRGSLPIDLNPIWPQFTDVVKFLFLGIAVILYLQPVAAEGCDAAPDPSEQHHAGHAMDSNHDCCGEESADPQEECDHVIQCGTCTGTIVAVVALGEHRTFASGPADWLANTRFRLSSYTSPPFKPPIS